MPPWPDLRRLTATPKAKTLELFGRPGPTGCQPFHVLHAAGHRGGFILDVLQNYTSYKLAFKLAHDGQEVDETQVNAAPR